MRYICKRCAYGTNIKCNLINHLSCKKPCKVKYLDIPIETLIDELDKDFIKMTQIESKNEPKRTQI